MRSGRIPVIRLWQRLVVPLQGDITDEAATALTEDILHAIREASASGLVIDVTGVWSIDSHLCFTLSKIAGAARLMGTPTVICGLSATIAMTLDTMGADISGADTATSLEEALLMLGVSPQFHAPRRQLSLALPDEEMLAPLPSAKES